MFNIISLAYLAVPALFLGAGTYAIAAWLASRRPLPGRLLIACAAIAPMLLLGIVLRIVGPIPVPFVQSVIVWLTPVAVFLVLRLLLKLEFRDAGVLAAGYLVLQLISRGVFAWSNKLFEPFGYGLVYELGPLAMLLTLILVPLAVRGLARLLGSPGPRVILACYGVAAIIAPSLIVGHGAAIVPAILVWPLIFEDGGTGLIFLITTFASVLATGSVLLIVAGLVLRMRAQHRVD